MKFAFALLMAVFLCQTIPAISQTGNEGVLSGHIVDTTISEKLQGASISVFHKKDSSVVVSGLTKQDGSFKLAVPFGEFIYKITFLGYKDIYGEVNIGPGNRQVNTGNNYLEQKGYVLEDVLIRASQIIIKGDTTEFLASNYKTIPNASAEDLLKKLPGMEVDKDGTIQSQGEIVTRILVDGKLFFSNDPKIASRNIPTEIIDKIQVIDALSDESAFTGVDNGQRVRTINIITKKDTRKGLFGKASMAGGDKGRYAGAISANRFNVDQQLSFILQGNNINNQNFSVEDFLGNLNTANTGSKNRGGGTKNIFSGNAAGISTTLAGGINYNDKLSKKLEINASYFYNNIQSLNDRDRYRETFVINDSSLFNTQFQKANTGNLNHRINLTVKYNIDSFNTLQIKPGFSYQQTGNNSQSESVTIKGTSKQLNNIRTTAGYMNDGIIFSNSIMYQHRFRKKGRSYTLQLNQGLNTNDRDGNNFFVNTRTSGIKDTTDQLNSTVRDGKDWDASFSYNEPVSKKAQVEWYYKYSSNQSESDQQTYNLDKIIGEYTIPVTRLTNHFENTNKAHLGRVSYTHQVSKKWNYSMGMGVQNASLLSNNQTKNTFIRQSFNNLFPTFNLQFKQSKNRNLRLIYRGLTRMPTVTQLQDVVNNNSILNIVTGNPSLRQEFRNNFTLRYTNYNPKTRNNFSLNLTSEIEKGKIVNSTIINSTTDTIKVDGYSIVPGARFSRPVNLDGAFDVGGNVNYSLPIKPLKGTLHIGSKVHYSKDVSMVNDVINSVDDYIINGSLRLTMNLKERFDLNLSANSSINIIRYSLQPDRNGDFYTHRFSAEPNFVTESGWIFTGDFDYLLNRGQSAGFNQSIPMLNAGIAKLFLKQRKGELRFTVFDLLNKNQSIKRVIEQNYVEDVKTQVLNRYFMLSFTYNIRKFGNAGVAGGNSGK